MLSRFTLLAFFTVSSATALSALQLTISPEAANTASGPTITVAAGARDYTAELEKVFARAPAGATVRFLSGMYPVTNGTIYVLHRNLILLGDKSTLINVRIVAEANITIYGVNFTERDCEYKSSNPSACPILPPMISLGDAKHAITQASISHVNLNYSRAYTGIAFGGGPIRNVSITDFSITDNQLSGITALGGTDITIANGTIYGGTDANVDDGIALYSIYEELSNVTVSNIRATNTFDAVGIGALMYYPLHDITVTKTSCEITAVCIYVKAGDQAPVPPQYAGYSHMDRLTVEGVTDRDPDGARYLSSVWIYAKGGATASAIRVSNVSASTRSASSATPRVWLFTDAKSRLSNIQMADLTLVDRLSGAASTAANGQPTAEGVFLEDQGKGNISEVTLSNISMNGSAYFAVDSSLAKVSGLNIASSQFENINRAEPKWPIFAIPYEYVLNGKATN